MSMCNWGNTVTMELTIPASLSRTGKAYRKPVGIDKCIAPIVKALNDGGVTTVASCCGHGKVLGCISLADGRQLAVYPDMEAVQQAVEKYSDITGFKNIGGE